MQSVFRHFASATAELAGSSRTFIVAAGVIVLWVITGPMFGFSDTWQLVINTGTTIVTFLMVFLVQNTQNRDARAVQLKLDELLRAVEGARQERFVDLEDRDEQELEEIRDELFEECGVCTSADEHARHPEAHTRTLGERVHSLEQHARDLGDLARGGRHAHGQPSPH